MPCPARTTTRPPGRRPLLAGPRSGGTPGRCRTPRRVHTVSETAAPVDLPSAPAALAVIGGGNMGAALIEGLVAAGAVTAADIVVVETSPDRRRELVGRFDGVAIVDSIVPCAAAVLAVKPPAIPEVATAVVRAGARRLLSIAAGVSTEQLDTAAAVGLDGADDAVAVVRAMPNTPSLVGRGVAAICGGRSAGPADLEWAESILGAVGTCVRLEERSFDAVTAVTGSGPAYVFFLAEALADAGVAAGLPAELVGPLVRDLLSGSAELLAREGDPVALRAMVTSPGGTTAAGVAVLEERDMRGIIAEVVAAAARRSRELAAGA